MQGLESGMSVSGGSFIMHVGFQCIFDQACMLVSDQACRSQTRQVVGQVC